MRTRMIGPLAEELRREDGLLERSVAGGADDGRNLEDMVAVLAQRIAKAYGVRIKEVWDLPYNTPIPWWCRWLARRVINLYEMRIRSRMAFSKLYFGSR